MRQETSKSTNEWLKKTKMVISEWPCQSLNLNLIEMKWRNFKEVAHAQAPPPMWVNSNHTAKANVTTKKESKNVKRKKV